MELIVTLECGPLTMMHRRRVCVKIRICENLSFHHFLADLTYYSFEKVLTNRHFKLYGDDLDSIYQAFENEKSKHPEIETTVEKVESSTQINHQNWKQPQKTIIINFSVETASFSAQEQKEKVLNIFDQISSRTKDTSVVIILPPRLPVNISEQVIEHSPLIMFNLRKIVLEQIKNSKQKKIAVVDFWQFTNSIKNLDRFSGKALKTVDLYVNLEMGHRGGIHPVGATSIAILVNLTPSTGGSRWI